MLADGTVAVKVTEEKEKGAVKPIDWMLLKPKELWLFAKVLALAGSSSGGVPTGLPKLKFTVPALWPPLGLGPSQMSAPRK